MLAKIGSSTPTVTFPFQRSSPYGLKLFFNIYDAFSQIILWTHSQQQQWNKKKLERTERYLSSYVLCCAVCFVWLCASFFPLYFSKYIVFLGVPKWNQPFNTLLLSCSKKRAKKKNWQKKHWLCSHIQIDGIVSSNKTLEMKYTSFENWDDDDDDDENNTC